MHKRNKTSIIHTEIGSTKLFNVRVSIHESEFMYICRYTCHGVNGVEVSGQLLVPSLLPSILIEGAFVTV